MNTHLHWALPMALSLCGAPVAIADEEHGQKVRGSAVVEVIDDPRQVEDIFSKMEAKRLADKTNHAPPVPKSDAAHPAHPPHPLERPGLPRATPETTPVDHAAGDHPGAAKEDHKSDRDRDRDRDRPRDHRRR